MKKVVAVFLCFIFAFGLIGCEGILVDKRYTIVNEQDVSTASEKRYVFRVVPEELKTEDYLKEVFKELDKSDYDRVVVWFYETKEQVEAGDTYTIGMVERNGRFKDAVVTMK